MVLATQASLFLMLLALLAPQVSDASSTVCTRLLHQEWLSESEFGRRMLDELESNYLTLSPLSPAQSNARMQEWLIHLKNYPKPKSTRIIEAPPELIDEIFSTVKNHPVASTRKTKKYDPCGLIGFCFGKAMTVHLEAIRRGVDKRQILKIWAVGSLENDDTRWKYHVATMVRTSAEEGAGWMVLDPVFSRAATLEEWFSEMRDMNPSGDLKTFVTEAKRYGVTGPEAYRLPVMQAWDTKRYFNDLLESFRGEYKIKTQDE